MSATNNVGRFNLWQGVFVGGVIFLALVFAWVIFLVSNRPHGMDVVAKVNSITGLNLLGMFAGLKYVRSGWQRSGSLPEPRMAPFETGLYGGLVGGLAAGILIAIMYYYNNVVVGKVQIDLITLPLTLTYASLVVGGLVGCAIQVGMQSFQTLASRRGYPRVLFNTVSGGVLCGTIGGSLVGAFGGWIFGHMPGYFVGTDTVWWPAALGAICLVLGILSLEFQTWSQFVRALVLVALLTTVLAPVGNALANQLKPDRFFFNGATTSQMILGGLLLGLPVGLLCGLESGVTLVLYRALEKARTPINLTEPSRG